MQPARRKLLFWGVCIPLRSYLASLGDWRPLRVFATVIGLRWLAGCEVGPEGFFGGPAFWADERPVHGVMWTAYAVSGESLFLWADTAFGAWNWLDSAEIG